MVRGVMGSIGKERGMIGSMGMRRIWDRAMKRTALGGLRLCVALFGLTGGYAGAADLVLGTPRPVLEGMSDTPAEANGVHYIRFEAEDAKVITPSFQVMIDKNCSGGKYVSLPEGVGSAWTRSGMGYMEYEIDIPVSGEYALWGRALWEHGCSSQMHVNPGGAKPIPRSGLIVESNMRRVLGTGRFGKNTTIGRWHWLGQDLYQLKKGKLKFTVANLEDGVAVDQWILVNNADFRPYQNELWKYDNVFLDENAAGWRYSPKQWSLEDATSNVTMTNPKKADEGEDEDAGGLFKTGQAESPALIHSFRPKVFYAEITWRRSAQTQVYLQLTDADNYDVIDFLPDKIRFFSVRGGQIQRTGEGRLGWGSTTTSTTVEVFREKERLTVLRGGEILLVVAGLEE